MNNGFFKYYKSGVLITLIAFLAITIFLAKDYWRISISIISVISAFLIIIDKCLWKTKLFSWMFWVENFSGRYEGELEYCYRDDNCIEQKGKLKHTKIIHQTGSRISVYSFTIKDDLTPSSKSENKGMHVEKLNGGKHFELTFNYLNDGNESLATHYGTDVLKFIRNGDKKFLTGRYYTERLPFQTKGKYLNLVWKSNDSEHDF
ncbi:MAG: hypothetical protein WD512_07955 [Candidatus Paceibacterota bacterium]